MASEYDALECPAESVESVLAPPIVRPWARDLAIVLFATVAAAAFAFLGGAAVLIAILAITLLAPVIAFVFAFYAVRADRRRTA